MIRAVLDTNVLLGALASTSGALREIAIEWQVRRFQFVASPHLLGELHVALQKPYWQRRLRPGDATRLLQIARRRADLFEPDAEVSGIASHEEDDLVIATALAGDAEYLVTGDKELLRVRSYRTVKIISPLEFLEILRAESESESES